MNARSGDPRSRWEVEKPAHLVPMPADKRSLHSNSVEVRDFQLALDGKAGGCCNRWIVRRIGKTGTARLSATLATSSTHILPEANRWITPLTLYKSAAFTGNQLVLTRTLLGKLMPAGSNHTSHNRHINRCWKREEEAEKSDHSLQENRYVTLRLTVSLTLDQCGLTGGGRSVFSPDALPGVLFLWH